MNEWIRRAALGAGIPVAVVAMGLIPFLVYRSDLPDRVASHYGISGRPDASPRAMNLAPGERVFWSSTLSARWPRLSSLATWLFALVVTQLTELLCCDDLAGHRDGLGRFQSHTSHCRPVGAASAIRLLWVASDLGTHTSHCHSSGHRHSPGRLGWLGIPGQSNPHETCCRGPACGSRHPRRPI